MEHIDQQTVLGRLCRDKVSLAEGICVGVLDWMFGCRIFILRRQFGKEKISEFDRMSLKVPEACLEVLDPDSVVDDIFPAEEEPRFFGKICRDKVTGYVGMCIGRCWEYYSEKQYCLQGKYNKKRMKESSPEWFDEGRIEVLDTDDGIEPEEVQSEHRGGIMDIALPLCC